MGNGIENTSIHRLSKKRDIILFQITILELRFQLFTKYVVILQICQHTLWHTPNSNLQLQTFTKLPFTIKCWCLLEFVVGLLLRSFDFKNPHKKKFERFKSKELGGQFANHLKNKTIFDVIFQNVYCFFCFMTSDTILFNTYIPINYLPKKLRINNAL